VARRVAARDPVAVLRQNRPVPADQQRAERLVPRLQRLGRDPHAPAQVPHVVVIEHPHPLQLLAA
jgi:hypothetical protein